MALSRQRLIFHSITKVWQQLRIRKEESLLVLPPQVYIWLGWTCDIRLIQSRKFLHWCKMPDSWSCYYTPVFPFLCFCPLLACLPLQILSDIFTHCTHEVFSCLFPYPCSTGDSFSRIMGSALWNFKH